MRFVYATLSIVFVFQYYDYTTPPPARAIFVVSLSPGEMSSGSIVQKY